MATWTQGAGLALGLAALGAMVPACRSQHPPEPPAPGRTPTVFDGLPQVPCSSVLDAAQEQEIANQLGLHPPLSCDEVMVWSQRATAIYRVRGVAKEAIIRASAAAPSISWVDRASLPDGGTADPYLCPGGESQILASVPAAAERLGQLQGCMPLSGLGHRLNTPIQRVVLVLLGSREVAVANWIYGEHEGQADGTIVFSDGQSFEVHVAR